MKTPKQLESLVHEGLIDVVVMMELLTDVEGNAARDSTISSSSPNGRSRITPH